MEENMELVTYICENVEQGGYYICDISKGGKTFEDFYMPIGDGQVFDTFKFREYIRENNCRLNPKEITTLLGDLIRENNLLKESNKILRQEMEDVKQILEMQVEKLRGYENK